MTASEVRRYRANVDELVHENVEGEVIIIHLSSGNYFSLTGSGARIWELLKYGADSESLAAGA